MILHGVYTYTGSRLRMHVIPSQRISLWNDVETCLKTTIAPRILLLSNFWRLSISFSHDNNKMHIHFWMETRFTHILMHTFHKNLRYLFTLSHERRESSVMLICNRPWGVEVKLYAFLLKEWLVSLFLRCIQGTTTGEKAVWAQAPVWKWQRRKISAPAGNQTPII